MNENNYINPKEAAKMLGVSPITVRHWANQGLLKSKVTASGHRKFDLDDVLRFIEVRKGEEDTNIRVLIIDDDKQLSSYICKLIEKWAERSFYQVDIECAMSGAQANASIDSGKPDLIFLDLMVPQMDGYSICKNLSASQSSSEIKIIAMTGYHNKANEDRITSLGAICCLEKPIDKDKFYSVLEGALPNQAVTLQ